MGNTQGKFFQGTPPDLNKLFQQVAKISKDIIIIRPEYIDMIDDLIAGILLSQMIYWHLPNKNGDSKLTIDHEGRLWLAKSWDDWWDEARISVDRYRRAIKILQDRELVITKVFKSDIYKCRTVHNRINWDIFLPTLNQNPKLAGAFKSADDFFKGQHKLGRVLGVKRIYVDMANDLIAGILLSQIVYEHLPYKDGKSKLIGPKYGYQWAAKSREDLCKETNISIDQYKRASKILQDKGLIDTKTFKFMGIRTLHTRLNLNVFLPTFESIYLNKPSKEQLKSKIVKYTNQTKLIKGALDTYFCGETKLGKATADDQPNWGKPPLQIGESHLSFNIEITKERERDNIDYRREEIIRPMDTTSANASVVSIGAFAENTTMVGARLGLRGEADKEEKSFFSTLILPSHPGGLFSLDSVCKANFGEHADFILKFLRGVSNSFDDPEKALLNFVNTISKDFSPEAILGGIRYVEQRCQEGTTHLYNLTYIRTGIEIYIAHTAANNIIGEGAMEVTTVGKFRRFCRTYFCKDDLGDFVYDFYKNKLTRVGNDDNKIKTIKYICENYGEQFLFSAMKKFIQNIDAGVYFTADSKSGEHFFNYVKKSAALKHNEPMKGTDAPGVDSDGKRCVIPVAIERVRYDFSGNTEWYDWSYSCVCGEPSLPLNYTHCPKCKHEIDWAGVIYKGVKCGFRASTQMFKMHKLM